MCDLEQEPKRTVCPAFVPGNQDYIFVFFQGDILYCVIFLNFLFVFYLSPEQQNNRVITNVQR